MTAAISLVDSHTHLDAPDFGDEQDAVVERARAAGVDTIVTIGAGYGVESAKRAVKLADRFSCVWATVGIHPHNSGEEYDLAVLKELARHPRVVGIGETGLDFFRDWAPVEKQEHAFRQQIELALDVGKPLVIHCRNAGPACMSILKEYDVTSIGGVFHCFAEDAEYARELRKLNFLVSFPGSLTFKKADAVREVCREVPLDQIMVETDAPFLAPEPHRGKRCETAFVRATATKMAEVKGISLAEVAATTTANAHRLFRFGAPRL